MNRLLNLGRIAVLPVVIYFLYQESSTFAVWSIVLLFISMLIGIFYKRKFVDSFIAPFADKFVIMGLLLVFLIRGSFNEIIFGLFVFRDLIASLFRWLAARDDVQLKGKMSSASITYAQYLILLGLMAREYGLHEALFTLEFVEAALFLLIVITVILSLWSIASYSYVYSKALSRRKRKGRKLTREKMVILTNKKSRGYRDLYRRRLLTKFAERRGAKIVYLPRTKNMYSGVMKNLKAEQIVIAGGDGSFESALSYKPFHKKSLGFFPLGAGNAYYSYFYKGKRFEYLRNRFHFHQTPLDILELEFSGKKIQTTFIALGVDADVMRLSTERTQHGFWDYVRGSWKAMFKARGDYDLTCKVDGKKFDLDNCVNLTVAKIPYYGFSLRSLLGEVKPANGKVYALAVVNTHSSVLNKPLRIWALLLAVLGMEKSPLVPLQGKKFVVKSDVPFPIQAGGEFLGFSSEVTVSVIRKQDVLVI